jgi:hypothetical protein
LQHQDNKNNYELGVDQVALSNSGRNLLRIIIEFRWHFLSRPPLQRKNVCGSGQFHFFGLCLHMSGTGGGGWVE